MLCERAVGHVTKYGNFPPKDGIAEGYNLTYCWIGDDLRRVQHIRRGLEDATSRQHFNSSSQENSRDAAGQIRSRFASLPTWIMAGCFFAATGWAQRRCRRYDRIVFMLQSSDFQSICKVENCKRVELTYASAAGRSRSVLVVIIYSIRNRNG